MLDWCTREGIPAIPYGGGSSVVGGVEPRFDEPAVTLDVSAMSAVLEVDQVSRAARIQAGALGPWIEDQLRRHDLTLRHFPQSFAFSSLGGWLATRAGGHFATLYTHIDDLTESVRVVTPAGVSESRRLPGSGAGPSPDRLFLGSEGTLGVITEAWMRLQNRPRWQVTASVAFERLGRRGRRDPHHRAGRAVPGELPTAGPRRGVPERRHARRGRAAGAGLRIRRPPDRPVAQPGRRDRRRARRHRHRAPQPRNRQRQSGNRRSRCLRELALGVPAHALSTRRAGTPRRHRRDFRNRLHLGRIRRPACRGDRAPPEPRSTGSAAPAW